MAVIQKILYVLLGIVLTVCSFCVVVAICSAVNGLTFNEQIIKWFTTPTTKELAKETTAIIKTFI